MKTVNKSVLIWYHPTEMYALVTDVAAYPQFLPWCDHAAVVSEDDQGMTAEVGIAFGGIRQTFTTRNLHTPVARGRDATGQRPFFPAGRAVALPCRSATAASAPAGSSCC
jgi:ribosome-associated toxin RatA of RatAB toxin-antitoxin module